MRKLILFSVAAALAACQAEPAPEATEDEAAATVDDAGLGLEVDGKPNVGTYAVTEADGTEGVYIAAADGTFTYTQGEKVTKGTWTSSAPGKWCDTPEGEAEICFTESIDENGVWTSVMDSDPTQVATIKRVE